MNKPPLDRRKALAWALYDWANSAFATTVIAGFFPIFFKTWLAGDLPAAQSTARLGWANSASSLVLLLIAPVLGALADSARGKKKLLAAFAALGAAMTGGLFFVQQGQWLIAAILYAVAGIGFAGGNVFYDALLVSAAPRDRRDSVSGLGYAMGYLGGGVLFAFNVWMVTSPATFGLADKTTAVRVSFLAVAAWWLLFSLPLFFLVDEPGEARPLGWRAMHDGFRQLRHTFHQIRQLRHVFLFLIAYWLYIDGVDTIIRMAVDYGLSLGFPEQSLIVALLITQFVGFPAALAYGYLGERYGAKLGIVVGIAVYLLVTIYAVFMDRVTQFYVLAIVVGLVQGGVQSLSRSYYSRLIPEAQAGEFFGFYNMLGKFAAVIGPVMMGLVAAWTGNVKLGILSIVLLFLGGLVVLAFVHEPTES